MKNKIWNRLEKSIFELQRNLRICPVSISLYRFISDISAGVFIHIHDWSEKRLKNKVLDYLKNNYAHLLKRYENKKNKSEKNEKFIIWVCWLQGEENAPLIVKQCIKTIKNHASDYEVIFISNSNYNEYIQLDPIIIEKYQKGNIGAAHFSDIIRVNLLNNYGGLWIDSTVYCIGNIDEKNYGVPFWSCKTSNVKNSTYISDYRWTTFLMGGEKHCLVYEFLCDFFDTYWKREKGAVDYLLMDYIMAVACETIPEINRLINEIPENNLKRDRLAEAMNRSEKWSNINNVFDENTIFYKVSWRENYHVKTSDGENTIYEQLFIKES